MDLGPIPASWFYVVGVFLVGIGVGRLLERFRPGIGLIRPPDTTEEIDQLTAWQLATQERGHPIQIKERRADFNQNIAMLLLLAAILLAVLPAGVMRTLCVGVDGLAATVLASRYFYRNWKDQRNYAGRKTWIDAKLQALLRRERQNGYVWREWP